MKNPFDLTGQVAVITGSSKGIGRSAAEIMASLGAKVVISSRKADACEAVAAGIRKAGGEAIVIPCNISRKEEVKALVKGTLEQWGRIDTLVCNAAVNPYFGPLANIPDDAFDKIMSLQHQEQPVAVQSRHARHGREGRRQRRHRLLDRRPARQRAARRLRHLQGRRHAADPQPGGGVGPEEHAHQLRRARAWSRPTLPAPCGRTRSG